MRLIETHLPNWEQLINLDPVFQRSFIFRGQSNEKWDLTTSIGRSGKYTTGIQPLGFSAREREMIDEFSRKYQIYSSHQIEEGNSFEYLALMQHYGAPTRLLDFTKSIFIASYFATEDSNQNGAIWAINHFALLEKFKELRTLKVGEYNSSIINRKVVEKLNSHISKYDTSSSPAFVLPAVPKTFSNRMSNQQGLFLVPSNSTLTFTENLYSHLEIKNKKFENVKFESLDKILSSNSTDIEGKQHSLLELRELGEYIKDIGIIKFILPKDSSFWIRNNLSFMNISAEVLFPGLEGLSKSLSQKTIRAFLKD